MIVCLMATTGPDQVVPTVHGGLVLGLGFDPVLVLVLEEFEVR